jgi:hypothetical protein
MITGICAHVAALLKDKFKDLMHVNGDEKTGPFVPVFNNRHNSERLGTAKDPISRYSFAKLQTLQVIIGRIMTTVSAQLIPWQKRLTSDMPDEEFAEEAEKFLSKDLPSIINSALASHGLLKRFVGGSEMDLSPSHPTLIGSKRSNTSGEPEHQWIHRDMCNYNEKSAAPPFCRFLCFRVLLVVPAATWRSSSQCACLFGMRAGLRAELMDATAKMLTTAYQKTIKEVFALQRQVRPFVVLFALQDFALDVIEGAPALALHFLTHYLYIQDLTSRGVGSSRKDWRSSPRRSAAASWFPNSA